MADWGKRLAEAAERKGWGPRELHDRTGIHIESLKKYLRGAVEQPRGKTLEKLADALDVPLVWLRDGFEVKGAPKIKAVQHFTPVTEVDVRASAGAGAVIDYERDGHQWGFPESWLRSEFVARANELRVITIDGDSMVSEQPRRDDLDPGDKVIVNIADRRPSPPGIFVIYDGIGLVAKRIEHIDGSDPARIRIMSNNSRYREYERTLDEAQIMGRVVGRWQRL